MSTDLLRILVIGGGGREHALAWKLAQSPRVERVYIAPGNGGTTGQKMENVNLPADDFGKLVAFAVEKGVNPLYACYDSLEMLSCS